MVELLDYLEANGFSNYIASGGGRDFMRPISQELYGIPRERVIGSASALEYVSDSNGGTITHKPEADYLDDGPQKPIRIWSRTGRRPLLAVGNSNGDIEMLEFARHQDKPFLPLLLLHDDAEREFDYVNGSERALARAGEDGWTVVSVKDDWARVFPTAAAAPRERRAGDVAARAMAGCRALTVLASAAAALALVAGYLWSAVAELGPVRQSRHGGAGGRRRPLARRPARHGRHRAGAGRPTCSPLGR